MKLGFGVRLTTCFLVASVAALAGCRNSMPHAFTWPSTGDQIPTHPKPPEGGYYKNWDPYAASIEITPVEDTNPVKTQHMLVATVRDKNGKPLPNRRVEWIINAGSVGDIVEVDESGWRAARGYKMTNSFAVSHTNNFKHKWNKGDGTPAMLEKGQTWCTITSPIEGNSYITAYCPAIFNWEKHKAFAVKHWRDIRIECPPAATNKVGTPHTLVTKVMHASDNSPYVNYTVAYKILSGPPAHFEPAGGIAMTDTAGNGTVTLVQDSPAEGTNEIGIEVTSTGNEKCCKEPELVGTCRTTKTWVMCHLKIAKNCPSNVTVNDEFDYQISVTNTGGEAGNVVLTDTLPGGVTYVSSNPAGTASGNTVSWNLGSLTGTANATVRVKAGGTEGDIENCAEVRADGCPGDRACCKTHVAAPSLKLELVCDATRLLCEETCATVTVTNTGQADARNIVINIRLPAGLKTTDGKSELSFGAPSLAPGRSRQAKFCMKAERAGTYSISASASADGVPSMEQQCSTAISEVNLTVTKTAPATRYVDRPVTYEITVTNPGTTEAKNVVLTDSPPPGLSASSATEGGRISGGSITWSLGNLAPGQSRKVSVTGTATQMGTLKNTARATAECAQAQVENNVEIKPTVAILLEVVDNPDPIEIGTQTTYTVSVKNQGKGPNTNIVVECTLPPEEEFVSAGGASPGTSSGKTVLFATLPSLAPGATTNWTVTVKGTGAGDVRFTTTLKCDQLTGPPVMETESTHIYE